MILALSVLSVVVFMAGLVTILYPLFDGRRVCSSCLKAIRLHGPRCPECGVWIQ